MIMKIEDEDMSGANYEDGISKRVRRLDGNKTITTTNTTTTPTKDYGNVACEAR